MGKFTCKKRIYSDQTICTRCNMTWYTNDIDPPKCKTGKELFIYMREKLKWMNRLR